MLPLLTGGGRTLRLPVGLALLEPVCWSLRWTTAWHGAVMPCDSGDASPAKLQGVTPAPPGPWPTSDAPETLPTEAEQGSEPAQPSDRGPGGSAREPAGQALRD